MARSKSQAAPHADVGSRLTSIRRSLGGDLSQVDFAARHNFGITTYNSWESGTRRITVDSAEMLCDAYGVTLDFIYRGRRDGLSEYALKVL
jgi:transcriptional regulator with XRE-family HTH domain